MPSKEIVPSSTCLELFPISSLRKGSSDAMPILRIYNTVVYSECCVDISLNGEILAIGMAASHASFKKECVVLLSLNPESLGDCIGLLDLAEWRYKFTSLELFSRNRILGRWT